MSYPIIGLCCCGAPAGGSKIDMRVAYFLSFGHIYEVASSGTLANQYSGRPYTETDQPSFAVGYCGLKKRCRVYEKESAWTSAEPPEIPSLMPSQTILERSTYGEFGRHELTRVVTSGEPLPFDWTQYTIPSNRAEVVFEDLTRDGTVEFRVTIRYTYDDGSLVVFLGESVQREKWTQFVAHEEWLNKADRLWLYVKAQPDNWPFGVDVQTRYWTYDGDGNPVVSDGHNTHGVCNSRGFGGRVLSNLRSIDDFGEVVGPLGGMVYGARIRSGQPTTLFPLVIGTGEVLACEAAVAGVPWCRDAYLEWVTFGAVYEFAPLLWIEPPGGLNKWLHDVNNPDSPG